MNGGLRIRFEEYSQTAVASAPGKSQSTRGIEESVNTPHKRQVSFRSTLEDTLTADVAASVGASASGTVPRSSSASVGLALETVQDKDENKVFVAAVRRGGPAANAVPPLLVSDTFPLVLFAMHDLLHSEWL